MSSGALRKSGFRTIGVSAAGALSVVFACAAPQSPPNTPGPAEPAPVAAAPETAPASPPSAPTTAAATASSTGAAAAHEPVVPSVPSSPPAEPAAPAEPAENEGPKLGRSVLDLITQRDVAFLVDYANSDAREKARGSCEKESQEDPEKLAACLAKARERFTADVLRFARDEGGRVTLKIYKRNGSSLSEVHVAPVELIEEQPSSVRVKWKNAGRGARPLFRSQRDAVLAVPNEYSLELNDPELGHLTYSAKIGLVAN